MYFNYYTTVLLCSWS